jgi:hypothetical protein
LSVRYKSISTLKDNDKQLKEKFHFLTAKGNYPGFWPFFAILPADKWFSKVEKK